MVVHVKIESDQILLKVCYPFNCGFQSLFDFSFELKTIKVKFSGIYRIYRTVFTVNKDQLPKFEMIINIPSKIRLDRSTVQG